MKLRSELDIRMASTPNGDLEVTLSDIDTGKTVESFLLADGDTVAIGSNGGTAEVDPDTGELKFTLAQCALKS